MSTSRFCTTLTLAIFATLGMTNHSEAKRKKGPKAACNMQYLPFVTGHTWTYQYVIPPGVEDRPGGIKAKVPETVTVTVKSIESKDGNTAITLGETYRDVATETVLTCGAGGLTVPLDSFYFAGELPGALGMVLENLALEGEMYPNASKLARGESLYVEIKADVKRTSAPETAAKHATAKLEIERQITIGSSEVVEVEHGIHTATAVEVAISGRAALEPTYDKKVSLPEGNAMLWFSDGVGLVRVYNRLGQGWELTTFKGADGSDIE